MPLRFRFGLCSPRQPNRHPDGDERDRMNPGSPAGASTSYGSVPLSLRQRQRITGNAFSNDMFQWVIPARQSTPLYAMSHQDCQMTLMLLTAPEMFALLSTMVEPDFMPRIPIFIREGHGPIPFQTRAPGTVPVKPQTSADYKGACMLRKGTHKLREYDPKIWIMRLFWKSKHRPITAEFDGLNWKTGDELVALRSLVNLRPRNAAQYYPPWLIEWAPDNKENIFAIPPGTTHFADHDCSDAYHSMKCSEAATNMGCSKYRNSLQQEVILEPQCCQQGQASSAAYFSPWVRYGYTHLLAQIIFITCSNTK